MRIADMLISIANWLESPNNEAVLLSEYDDDCLKIVTNSCVEAAALLKVAANKVDFIEPEEESKITPESLDELASLAEAFDASGDPNLKKQASVIDELLLTIAAPQNFLSNKKAEEEARIDTLKNYYKSPRESLLEDIKAKEAQKVVEESKILTERKIPHGLSTRYDPDHPGVLTSRVEDGIWQSEMTKKLYNYNEGYKSLRGDEVPGGNVSEQTQVDNREYHSIFNTREDRLSDNQE